MSTHFLMIQDAIKRILSIALFIILARLLDQETFGHYQQVMLVISFMAMIFTAGLPIALSFFYGQERDTKKSSSIFHRFLFYQICSIVVGAILYLIFSGVISDGFENTYLHDYAFYIVIIFIGIVLPDFIRNSSVLFNTMKSYTIITSSIQIIAMLTTITLAIKTQNIQYLIIVGAISAVVLTLSLIISNRRKIFPFNISIKDGYKVKVEAKYILAMSATSFVGVINSYTDQITASFLLTPIQYSLLKVGAFQIPFISIVTGSILTAMIPIVSKLFEQKKFEEIENLWAFSIEKASVLLVPIVIFCMVFGRDIIIGFFGNDYQLSVLVFQIYMFQWLRAVVVFGGVMGAIGLEKELFKNTVVIAAMNIVLNIFMIHKYGIIGAAITTTVMNYFGGLLLIKKIDGVLNKKFFEYFPVKSYFLLLISSLILSIVLKIFVPVNHNIMILIPLSIVYYSIIILSWVKYKGNKICIANIKGLL